MCKRRMGKRWRAREGACTGDATTPQPSMLRLIRNAAALAAASATLLVRARGENGTCPRVVLLWHCCGSEVRLGLPVGRSCVTVRSKTRLRLAASLVSQVLPDFHVAAPVACAGRDDQLRAHLVSSRAEERAKHGDHAVVRLGCTRVSGARACVVAVKVYAKFLQPHFASGV